MKKVFLMTLVMTMRMILSVETKYLVATASDIDAIYAFAEENFHHQGAAAGVDEMDRTIALWNIAWRREALEHYLKLGWSFKAEANGRVCGFFLAQPFLFFRGMTQTLWVESVVAADADITHELCAIAIGIGREKHLQQVLFSDTEPVTQMATTLAKFKPRAFADGVWVVPTTKG